MSNSNDSMPLGSQTGPKETDRRSEALQPGPYRSALLASHPLVEDRQLMLTVSIQQCYALLCDSISNRKNGVCGYAQPDMGKSSATVVIKTLLQKNYAGIPVYRVSAKGHDTFNEKALWTDIARAMGLAISRTASAIMKDIENAIRSDAYESGNPVAIMIVDEGQNWGAPQWRFLKGLLNDLADPENDPVRLVTLTFAQPEVQNLISEIEKLPNKGRDLKSRFFQAIMELHGVRTKKELSSILQQYDDPTLSAYPVGSGISYSELFLPAAYSSSWRLESEVGDFWRALRADKSIPFGELGSVPLNRIFIAARRFLVTASSFDSTDFRSKSSQWDFAVTGKLPSTKKAALVD